MNQCWRAGAGSWALLEGAEASKKNIGAGAGIFFIKTRNGFFKRELEVRAGAGSPTLVWI